MRESRKKIGLTQIELAELLGTSQKVITNYERNLRKPSVDKLPEIAKVLKIELDELLGVTKRDEEAPRVAHNTREKQMLEAFQKLKPADQRAILKQTKALGK